MFGFFKRKKNHDNSADEQKQSAQQEPELADAQQETQDEPDHSSSVVAPSEQDAPVEKDQVTSPELEEEEKEHEAFVPQLDTSENDADVEEDNPAEEVSARASEPTHSPQIVEESEAEAEASGADSAHHESDVSGQVQDEPEVESQTPPAPEPTEPSKTVESEPLEVAPNVSSPEAEDDGKSRGGWFSRIRSGLSKTRNNFTGGLATLFLGQKEIDDELIEDLETQLLVADVGVEATTDIIDRLTERVSRKELSSADALYKALQEELGNMLKPVEKPLVLPPKGQGPFVILVIGVNGVGKTTTIGKLARRYKSEGRSVMLAAGDTFRAAAVEQLKVWGERNEVAVVAQHTGADSASVIYDALSAARSRNVDVLIADTAGRLHNKSHLMEELKKVQRVMAKLDPNAPHEVMLVVDAGTGQNAISQAETFGDAIPITGIALTKLDGTAKGGVIFALAKQLGIPIRYIGVGETLEDLRPFEAAPFTDALFDQRSS